MTDQPISFDDASASPGAVACARCQRPLNEYWSMDGRVLCESCKDAIYAEQTSSEGAAGRVGKALAYGIGGMVVGAAVWYTVTKLSGWEIGLIAILLGWLVGKGVFLGSGKRGGRGYQVLAVTLAYLGIGLAGVPFVVEGWLEQSAQVATAAAPGDTTVVLSDPTTPMPDSQAAVELARLDSSLAAGKALEEDATEATGLLLLALGLWELALLAVQLPVYSVIGSGSPIIILIYGFALWEAWKLAAKREPEVSGPHAVQGAPA